MERGRGDNRETHFIDFVHVSNHLEQSEGLFRLLYVPADTRTLSTGNTDIWQEISKKPFKLIIISNKYHSFPSNYSFTNCHKWFFLMYPFSGVGGQNIINLLVSLFPFNQNQISNFTVLANLEVGEEQRAGKRRRYDKKKVCDYNGPLS